MKKLEAKFQMEKKRFMNETMQFKVKIWQAIKDGKETYLLRIHIFHFLLIFKISFQKTKQVKSKSKTFTQWHDNLRRGKGLRPV